MQSNNSDVGTDTTVHGHYCSSPLTVQVQIAGVLWQLVPLLRQVLRLLRQLLLLQQLVSQFAAATAVTECDT